VARLGRRTPIRPITINRAVLTAAGGVTLPVFAHYYEQQRVNTMWLRQSTASQEVQIGKFVSDTDGKTAQTGLTIANTDIKLWVEGATTQANKTSGGATHIANGWYYTVLDATDTATLGKLEITVDVSGALSVRRQFMVLPPMIYDSLVLGTDRLDTNVTHIADTSQTARDIGASVLLSSGTGTGQISLSSGAVLLQASQPGVTIPVVTTVTNQLTGAQIATAIWQDSTAGDFTTASSIGKALYISNIAPGAAGGHMISGSNAGTTTFGALTVTGATTLTGNMLLSDGLTVASPSTSNRTGISITGNGTGHGILITSGSGATGDGARFVAASTNGNGFNALGVGTGDGLTSTGGATGHGVHFIGGATSGNGMRVEGTAGNSIALNILGQGSAAGLSATGGATGAGVAFVGGATSGNAITTSATSGTTYINANATHLLGTAWLSPGTPGTPDVNTKLWNGIATVALPLTPTTAGRTLDVSATGEAGIDWANIGTPTSTNNLSGTTIATANTVTGQLTGAQIATAIWQDSTGSDFTTASSIGKALYTGNIVPGAAGGHFIAGTNAATTITTGLTTTFTGNLTGSVGSIASGGITSASFAGDAISAASVASATVDKIWAKTMTELSAVPGVTADALSAIAFIFEMTRNKITQTATTQIAYKDDGSTALATATVSDDGTTFTRGEFA